MGQTVGQTFHLHHLTAAELGRATRVIRAHLVTLGRLADDYADAGDEIRADEDALGFVLVALLHASKVRADEDAAKEYLDAS